jgi:hypothetical protein
MAQITIYLPNDIESAARKAAKAKRTSVSRWIADQIQHNLAQNWPQAVLEAAGAVPDFPALEEIRKGYGRDARRASLK